MELWFASYIVPLAVQLLLLFFLEIVLLIIVDLIIASFMEYLPPPSTEWLKQILNGEKWHSPKYEFCQIRQVELLVNFLNKPVGLLIMYLEITKVNSKVEDPFFFKIFDFSAIFWKWYTWNIFHSVLKNDFRCKHLLVLLFLCINPWLSIWFGAKYG